MISLSTLLLFIAGFTILVKGANVLIDGALSVARLFKVSDWVVGVVVVGIGTSIPEFAITLASALDGGTVGLGTVVGSNTFNLLMILGAVAIISPIVMKERWVRDDLLTNIASIGVVAAAAFFPLIGDTAGVSRGEGAVIAILFIAWLIHMMHRRHERGAKEDYRVFALSTSLLMIVGGLIGVYVGGNWVVVGAEAIARTLGISEALLGVTLLGIGTSLPELTVSLSAAWKGRSALAVGNIIGSNIFDFLGIVGIAAIIRPLAFPAELAADIAMTAFASIILLALLYGHRKMRIGRGAGLLLISIYLAYLAFVITRIV